MKAFKYPAGKPVRMFPPGPSSAQLANKLRRPTTFDFVFDGPPGPDGPRFIEVEDGYGNSLNVGEWMERSDGYWVLRLHT